MMTLTGERLRHENENGLPTTYGLHLLHLRRRQAQEKQNWDYLGDQIGVDFQTNTPIYLVSSDVVKEYLKDTFEYSDQQISPEVMKLWMGPHRFPYGE